MSGYIGNTPIPQATQTRDSFTATASQTSFATGGYTPNFLDVYLNGLKLNSSQFTATNGTDVVLTSAASANDIVEVIAYTAFEVADASFDDLALGGDLTVGGTVDGRDIAADGTKLDGIESGATGDQTNAEIRAAVEAATDSNVFTDADHTKLNAIESGATADQTAAEIRTLVESATDSNVFTDADHTKLNAIESGATADQTKSDIDALNINADTLDGQHGSYYTGYADTAVANIVDSAPGTLDTLNELAAALGDDPNFATTTANNIATKLPLAGGTLTGNLDVGGTVTADGLTVDGDVNINDASPTITITDTDGSTTGFVSATNTTVRFGASTADKTQLYTSNLLRLNIDTNGDISFYEDTGSTAKFFWDASAESLGIGQGVYSGTQALNLKGEGIAIKNDKSGSNNNWSLIRNTGTASTSNISFVTGSGEAMVLAHNKNVGIGTSSPDRLLTLQGDNSYMWMKDAGGGNVAFIGGDGSNDGFLRLYNGSHTAKVEIQSDGNTYFNGGNVGIGTSSPNAIADLHVADTSDARIWLDATSADTMELYSGTGVGMFNRSNSHLILGTNNTERMRIDSSGRLLVGTTSTSVANSGFRVYPNDFTAITTTSSDAGDRALLLNRQSSDGTLLEFRKANSAVGSIGTANSGDLYIGNDDTTLLFAGGSDAIIPRGTAGATRDGAIDLGLSSHRFKDLHLSGLAYTNKVVTQTVFREGADGSGLHFTTNAIYPTDQTSAISNGTESLGASGYRFKDLYLSGSIANPSGNLTLDASGIINLDADNGGNINLKDGGTHYGTLQNENSDLRINSIIQDKDIIFRGNDGGTGINALTLDMSNSGRAYFNAGASFNGGVNLTDNDKLICGTHDDLQIYHDGSNSYIKHALTSGWLNMPMSGNGISIANGDFSEQIATFSRNGSCAFYHNGSKKLETTSSGVTVTGTVAATSYTGDGSNLTGISAGGLSSGFTGAASGSGNITVAGTYLLALAANGNSQNNGYSVNMSGTALTGAFGASRADDGSVTGTIISGRSSNEPFTVTGLISCTNCTFSYYRFSGTIYWVRVG